MRAKQIVTGLWRTAPTKSGNPLMPAVEGLGPGARRAMLAAASAGPLRRRSWDGCPLNRAGEVLGCVVRTRADAQRVFGVHKHAVERFLYVWDHLCKGDETACTALLVDAIRVVEGPLVSSEFVVGTTAASVPDHASEPSISSEASGPHEVCPL